MNLKLFKYLNFKSSLDFNVLLSRGNMEKNSIYSACFSRFLEIAKTPPTKSEFFIFLKQKKLFYTPPPPKNHLFVLKFF